MVEELTVSGTVQMYYRDGFIGRDPGQRGEVQYGYKWGLTNWIAESFDLLDLGEAPFEDDRRVNISNRSQWKEFTKTILDRWFPNRASRFCFRKSMKFNDGSDTWEMFPHPDDARGLGLSGRQGEIPIASVSLNTNPKDAADQRLFLHGFRSKVISSLDENDCVITTTIDLDDSNDFDPWDWVAAPKEILSKLKTMKSTKQNIENRMKDWTDYLTWMYETQRENEWGAKITKIRQPIGDDPYYVFTVQAPRKVWNRIKGKRAKGSILHGVMKEQSKDSEVWTRTEESQDGRNRRGSESDAGILRNVRGKQQKVKGGLLEGRIAVEPPDAENLLSGLGDNFVGHFLINDVSRDLIQIDRQRKGLQRLMELESNYNNVHEWLFDISRARRGLKEPPDLEHPPLAPLNEEQDWAVRAALNAPDVFLIQGPPGTGKTTVIAEIINQATENGQRVLLASQSNLAVDNALGRLAKTPNVRPIRRYSASAEVDPEAERFLENNVIRDFFVPSIREHCGRVHRDSEDLRRMQEAILASKIELPQIKNEWRTQNSILQETESRRTQLLADERDVEDRLKNLNHFMGLLSQADVAQQDGRIDLLTPEMAAIIDLPYDRIGSVARLRDLRTEWTQLFALHSHLQSRPEQGELSPDMIRIQSEMEAAASNQDYTRAAELKSELDRQLRESTQEDSELHWAIWTRELARLLPDVGFTELRDLLGELQIPADLESILEQESSDLQERILEIQSETDELGVGNESVDREIQDAIVTVRRNLLSSIEECESELQSVRESREKLNDEVITPTRRVEDAVDRWIELIDGLPESIVDESHLAIEGSDPEHILRLAEDWLQSNKEEIEADDRWRNIRRDWLKDLEEPKHTTLRDLEQMYHRMVNIEGVTTSYAGIFSWYKHHLQNPYDFVIIDEISKATPPELLLPMLLGRKAILVGDHRQLPPTFKRPRSKEEVSADELVEEDGRYKKFERMVTAALFSEYFQEADETLKCTLRVQYRMHEQIMRCTNEFYEGQLTCGLDTDQQRVMKEHGFTIVKRDSGGTSRLERSELITPNNHAVWIDSSFDRKGRYCSEMSPEHTTSRRNEREVRIARRLIEEFDEQIGRRKEVVPEEEWFSDSMLRHLDPDGRLPVGFITFYRDQTQAFREIANEGDSWLAMRTRWPNLTVRADTVDRFQGGERPVVMVSMVVSPEIDEGRKKAFERKVSKLLDKPVQLMKKKGFQDGGIPSPRTRFVRSPERINVALSRAQNLLIILGNRYSLNKVNDVRIRRDDGREDRKSVYRQIQSVIGEGGMVDGRDLL